MQSKEYETMKTVKVRVNTTIEYEVTLEVMDDYNDDQIRKLAFTLEGMNLEDYNAKEIAVYNDMLDWYVVDKETV
jgi:hypothetical protein